MAAPVLMIAVAAVLAVLLPPTAPRPATMHDPQAQCERYSDETYARMRDDEERTSAYEAAIKAQAPGRVCLDIGTGALALLALTAARAGARHVYAIEANAAAARAARAAVAAAGMADRVTVLEGFSTAVGALPEPVELLLHEIVGELAGYEGVVAAVRDARRHLPPARGGAVGGSVSIPARVCSLVAPCEFPPEEYFASLPFPMLAAPGSRVLKLPSLPRSLELAPPQVFEDLRFEAAAPEPSQRAELAFEARREGALRGLCVHVELFVSDGDAAAPEVSSARPGSHWPNVMLLLPDEVAVRAGDRLAVRTRAELGGGCPNYWCELLRESRAPGGGWDALGEWTYPEGATDARGSWEGGANS